MAQLGWGNLHAHWNQTVQNADISIGSQNIPFVSAFAWSSTNLQYQKLLVDASGNLMVTGGGGGGGGVVTQGTIPWVTAQQEGTYSSQSGSSTVTTNIHTPAIGKSVHLYYYMLNADAGNSNNLNIQLSFTSGTQVTNVSLVPGSILARNVGAGKYYLTGAVNDSLVLTISGTGTVNWAIEYLEA